MGDSSAFATREPFGGEPLAHSLEEDRLKTPVMDQNWVLDFYEFGQELPPDVALVRRTVSPKAVLNDRVARFDSNANQVVEVSIGQTLDIDVNRCAFDLHFWAAHEMDFLLPDCKRPQRVVVPLSLIP